MQIKIIRGDARHMPVPDESVQCIVTSPPYWGLRKYAGEQELVWSNGAWRGAFGLEPAIEMYVAHTLEILRECRRVLRPDGVLFLNLGDSYASGGNGPNQSHRAKRAPSCGNDDKGFLGWMESDCACSCHDDERLVASSLRIAGTFQRQEQGVLHPSRKGHDSGPSDSVSAFEGGVAPCAQESNTPAFSQSSQGNRAVRFCSDCLQFHRSALVSPSGILYHIPKPKDLCLIPHRVALAAQADSWWVRSMIIWAKPNPMPESVRDRPTDAYEHIIMFTKNARYFWDADAVAEPSVTMDIRRPYTSEGAWQIDGRPLEQRHGGKPRGGTSAFRGQGHFRDGENGPANRAGRDMKEVGAGLTRNIRNVWTFATQPFRGAHFATFPEELARRCILAASRPGDTVLDPFAGSGTVGQVAHALGRNAILNDLAYQEMQKERVKKPSKAVIKASKNTKEVD